MKKWQRVLLGLGLLVLLPPALLLALNIFINYWLPPIINRQPERMQVEWDFAWTLDLKAVHLENLRIRVQGPVDQWYLGCAKVDAEVDLRGLWEQRLVADHVYGEGAFFYYRSRKTAPDPSEPPIPGLQNPPLHPPETLYPPPAAPWMIALSDVRVRNVERAWFNSWRLDTKATLTGEMVLVPTSTLEISDGRLAMDHGVLFQADIPVLTNLDGRLDFSTPNFNPSDVSGEEAMTFVRAVARLSGEASDLGILDSLFQSTPWLGLSGGSGAMEVVVGMEQGELQPGSRFEAMVEDLELTLGRYVASGSARIEGGIDWVEDLPQAAVDLVFERFVVRRQGDAAPHVRGAGLNLHATSPDVALNRPFTRVDATVRLPSSSIPDLRVYNVYLPSNVNLRLLGGSASISAFAKTSAAGTSGYVDLVGKGVDLRFNDYQFATDLNLHGAVVLTDLAHGRLNISGSSLSLQRSVFTPPRGEPVRYWNAKVTLKDARVHVGGEPFLQGQVLVTCLDTRPFVAVLRSNVPTIPGWVAPLLRVQHVLGSGRIAVGDEEIEVRNLVIEGGGFGIEAEVRQRANAMEGSMLARYRKVAASFSLAESAPELHVLDARKWYESHRLRR